MTTQAPTEATQSPATEATAVDIPIPAPGQGVQLGVDAETGEIVLPGGTVPAPGEKPADEAPPLSGPPPAVDPEALARAQDVVAKLRAKRLEQRRREAEEHERRQRSAALESTLTAEQRARQAAEERAARAESDPLAAMRARGQDPSKVLAQAALDANSPEGKIAALERMLAETQQQLRGFVQTDEQRRQHEMISQGRERVAQMAISARLRDDEGKFTDEPIYPLTARAMTIARPAAIAEYERLWRVARDRGYNPTPQAIFDHMETQYEALYAERATTKGTRGAAESGATPPAPEKTNGKPAAAAARTVAKKTNERPTTPRSFDDLSPDEQIEAMMEQARKLQQAG